MSLEFFTLSTPTARKEHVCDFCCGKIKIGEKYSRFSGKYDGEMFDTPHHLLCAEIIRQYCNYIGEDEYDIDSVYEWAQETACTGCEHFDDERDDYTPCNCSLHECPKIIERFSKEALKK